jgi:hypothetical protein
VYCSVLVKVEKPGAGGQHIPAGQRRCRRTQVAGESVSDDLIE